MPLELGQGTFPNPEQLAAILKAANEQGLKVSLSHDVVYAPKGYSFDAENVRKTLLFTAQRVGAAQATDVAWKAPLPPVVRGFGGPPKCCFTCPKAQHAPGGVGLSLCIDCVRSEWAGVARPCFGGGSDIKAYRCGQGGDWRRHHDRKAPWVAPAQGEWQAIGIWSQGANTQNDLFSKEGTDELIRGMEGGLDSADQVVAEGERWRSLL